jgi:hypothetical protein
MTGQPREIVSAGPRRMLAVVVWSLWWGGLTFYAGVVVPLGTRQLGSVDQGFITQQVTHVLNGLAAASLLVSARGVWRLGTRWERTAWLSAAISLACLVIVHGRLDALLDTTQHIVHDESRFYRLHQLYLWLTVVQWLAGLGLLRGLVRSPANVQSASTSTSSPT